MPEVVIEGQTVAYDRIDLAPPWRQPTTAIMFLHGVGADRDIWSDWLPHLADRYSVLRLDMPGHGQSAPWNSAKALNFDFYVSLIRGVMARERIDSLILIGESMGGTIALYAASEMGDSVKAVATCSTAHRGGTLRNIRPWREIMEQEGMAAWSEEMLEKTVHARCPGSRSPCVVPRCAMSKRRRNYSGHGRCPCRERSVRTRGADNGAGSFDATGFESLHSAGSADGTKGSVARRPSQGHRRGAAWHRVFARAGMRPRGPRVP